MKSFCLIVVFSSLLVFVNSANVEITGRIVGGTLASIRRYPYAVSVRIDGNHVCGGSIISETSILTAAHCTDGKDNTSFSIRHGSSIADDGIYHDVIQVIQHPNFTTEFNRNDVSILKIDPPIDYTSSSRPARLATTRSADNSSVEICGWGVRSYGGSTDDLGALQMQAVTLRIVNQEICYQKYDTTLISNKTICAGAKGKDSCQGDSGGALIDSHTRKILGISSFGDGCADDHKPGVYASVPDLMQFIKDNM